MKKCIFAALLALGLAAGEAGACGHGQAAAFGYVQPAFATASFFSSGFGSTVFVQPTNTVLLANGFGSSVAVAGGRRSGVAVVNGGFGLGSSVVVAGGRRSGVAVAGGGFGSSVAVGRSGVAVAGGGSSTAVATARGGLFGRRSSTAVATSGGGGSSVAVAGGRRRR